SQAANAAAGGTGRVASCGYGADGGRSDRLPADGRGGRGRSTARPYLGRQGRPGHEHLPDSSPDQFAIIPGKTPMSFVCLEGGTPLFQTKRTSPDKTQQVQTKHNKSRQNTTSPDEFCQSSNMPH